MGYGMAFWLMNNMGKEKGITGRTYNL